ncbi:MAG: polysaccharide biosynthesis C-terminal domain-containing protein [Lewinellaceae bacterium]|nr:polysaccharide biosynthesis C-terminal domain-containing protein [Saprospiraceae bacterium]MCB9342098.1 polysaccharide biosynthesis C-terminal domain-containing protein [Lewinellaceae bacterium]
MTTTLALQFFQMMRMGSAILTGILLAKTGLSTAEIGAWEMLLYLGTTFTFFWVNGLLQGMLPIHSKLGEAAQKEFIFNNFLLFCGIALVVFLVLIIGESWIAPALTGLTQVPYFKLFCFYLLFNLPSYPVENIYLVKEHPLRIALWGMAIFGLHLVAIFLPILLGLGLGGGIKALVVLGFLKFLWSFRLALSYGSFKFNPDLLKALILFSAPLMLTTVVGNLMLLFDNWLVNWHFKDPSVFAIYRYGAREFPLALALLTALGTSLIPNLSVLPEIGLRDLKSKSLRLMHLLFPLNILLICTSAWLFPRVFNPDFALSAPIFNIYLLTLASRVLLPASIMMANDDSGNIFRISILEMSVKVILGFWFIRLWGLEGLAWSVVISFWVEKIGLILILELKHGIRTLDWVSWKWYLFYVSALFVSYWIQ